MSVVVVGASGLVGTAVVEACLAAGTEVVAVSRRRPEVDEPFAHLPLDLRDPGACATALTGLKGVTHLVYAAVHELPGLVPGWKDPEQMTINEAMLRHVLEPLTRSDELQHVTLLQGTKAYGVHHHPIRTPAKESELRDPHENFYWLQEDLLRAEADRAGFGWTIFRPPLIVGPTYGVAMNVVPVIAAYAAIRAREGLPFSYPGGPTYVAEAVDVRLLADAILWAGTNESARNQHFNISNGEVFAWRDLWPSFAAALGVEQGPDQPGSVAAYLASRHGTWDRIVAEHGLRPVSLSALVGASDQYVDFQFAARARIPPFPALMSTVKLHRAGFCAAWNTEESFQHWFEVLARRRIMPRLRR